MADLMTRTLVSSGGLPVGALDMLRQAEKVDILCSASGRVPRAFSGSDRLALEPGARLPASTVSDYQRAMLQQLADQIDALPQTPHWERLILHWIGRLGSADCRVWLAQRSPVFTRMLSRPDKTLVRAGPLVPELDQDELQLELTGQAHTRARAWFAQHLDGAEDISDAVGDVLRQSWAAALVEPEDLYLKVLYEYFSTTLDGLDRTTDANPMLEWLTDFQAEAYHFAKGILRRYGGVFLADVVGLGKTWIAMALLRHLHDRYGHDAVVIAPPAVLPAWRELAEAQRVPLGLVSMGKLDDLDRFQDREVLVVDESHNFRNVGTARYDRVQRWLRPGGAASSRQVLLLSATPQNNDPKDILAQLRLFPDNYTQLPYQGESLDEWFREARHRPEDLAQLLQHVVVRRTRTFIKAAYPDATLRVRTPDGEVVERPLRFPKRISGANQCLRYTLDRGQIGAQIYDRTIQRLEAMSYPLHGLALYVHEDRQDDPKVRQLRRTGRGLRGLYKVLLLKRLESSLYAFSCSAERLYQRLDSAVRGLALDRVPIHADEVAEDLEDESSEPSASAVLSADLFDKPRLMRDLQADRRAVRAMLDDIEMLSMEPDAKLLRLKQWLTERPPPAHRTIVFTQFADTARWLAEQLAQDHGRTALVTGSTAGRDKLARRFSPRSNHAEVAAADELDLLVSTDALSEGVNLQDADTLVNYDLHWNPVRLIQRAGRIDRIGSQHDEIQVASFLPERGLEANLGMEEVLRRRIEEFLRVFGNDSGVLPTDDQPDVDQMMSAYSGEALERSDAADDMDALSRHVSRILSLRREQPERFARVATMRLGRRSISAARTAGVAACKVGWFWRFWRSQDRGELEVVDDVSGLEALHEHSEAGAGGPARAQLGDVAQAARQHFEDDARTFIAQRTHPRLSAAEEWVLRRLDDYRQVCVATQRDLVAEVREWVVRGQAKVVFRREAAAWKKQNLSAAAVFHEVRRLAARFPGLPEDLGEPALVGVVLGPGEGL